MIIDCSIVNLERLGWSREYQPLLVQTITSHGSLNVTVDDCSAYQEKKPEYQKPAFVLQLASTMYSLYCPINDLDKFDPKVTK
jgi:hypothetical protein